MNSRAIILLLCLRYEINLETTQVLTNYKYSRLLIFYFDLDLKSFSYILSFLAKTFETYLSLLFLPDSKFFALTFWSFFAI